MKNIKELIKKALQEAKGVYFYSNLFQWISNPILGVFTSNFLVNHLVTFSEEKALGPLQRDEACLLFGLVKVLKPNCLVEFGFNDGHSSFNFLQAMGGYGELHSFDISEKSAKVAKKYFKNYANFHYHGKSQADFDPSDISGKKIDFVFFDGAHDLKLNCEAFKQIQNALSPNATICVHDTGLWNKTKMKDRHHQFAKYLPENWLNDMEFQHQKDERRFSNWLVSEHSYSPVHCHSGNCLRHGLTLLQNIRYLETSHQEYLG